MILTALFAAFLVSAQPATAGEEEFQTISIKSGDTLRSISARYLLNPTNWRELVNFNEGVPADPNTPLVGTVIRIPMALLREDMRAARLVSRKNSVLYRRRATAAWDPTTDNMQLFRNDWIRTETDSSAEVRFHDGDNLRLGADSMSLIKPVGKDYAVELQNGGTYVGSAKIVTASAVITPQTKGTRYVATLRDDMSTKVEVLLGVADVEAGGRKVSVKSGMAAEVKMGQAPSAPTRIPDMPAFEARAAGLGDAAAPKVASVAAPALGTAPSADLRPMLIDSKMDSMVSGYRIQCGAGSDFSTLLVNKISDMDETVTAEHLGIPSGRYWCRIAPLDLLGAQGKFTAPRQLYIQ